MQGAAGRCALLPCQVTERKNRVVLIMDDVTERRGCRVGVAWVCGAWRGAAWWSSRQPAARGRGTHTGGINKSHLNKFFPLFKFSVSTIV